MLAMTAESDPERTVSRKLVGYVPRLTHRRLVLIFSSLCLFLVLCACLLSNYQYDISHALSHKVSLNWMPRGGLQRAPKTTQLHLKDSLGNVFIRHQYEDWLQQTGNESFDLRPESSFMNQQASIQGLRKRALQQVCRRHPELSDVKFTRTNTRVLFATQKTRLLYCIVPKAGCTNWKKVLMVLEGHRKYVWNITGYQAHKQSPLLNMSSVPQIERNYILQNYIKFMYVRHPFVRLISAYRNKIARDIAQQGKVFQGYARKIAGKYREGAPLDKLKEQGNYNVTWEEWITYLTDPSELNGFNQHWMEFYKLCFPCTIDYDFIGHLETISSDSAYMLSVLGYDNVSYPSSGRNSSAVYYDQYFANVSRANLWKLWKIYALDFKLFGFPKPEALIGSGSMDKFWESSY